MVGAKKLGGSPAVRKRPIGSTNNQWGMNNTPTDKSFTLSLFFRVYVVVNVTVKEGALKTYNNFQGKKTDKFVERLHNYEKKM
ncbi:hypothetical protein B5P40_25620 [Bacillus sp. SRB_8]|nr:hypothetical protein B5P40_25620 [Bacillus sp. SRB_8]